MIRIICQSSFIMRRSLRLSMTNFSYRSRKRGIHDKRIDNLIIHSLSKNCSTICAFSSFTMRKTSFNKG